MVNRAKTGQKQAIRKPPVTLSPLSFEQAVTGLLGVKPYQKKRGAKKKPGKK